MTMFSTLLLLALTTQTPAGAPEPPISEITVKYNKFDDFTAIRLDLGSFIDDRGTFVASLGIVCSGKARPEELRSRVNLHIYRYDQMWEFLLEHQPPKKMRLGMLLGRAQGCAQESNK